MPTKETSKIVSGTVYLDGVPIGKINGDCSALPTIEFTPRKNSKTILRRLNFWLYRRTWRINRALFKLRLKFL